MTYHLASLRLHSIGERSARFTDLTLDMTGPNGSVAPAPTDSIVWLRNGGGKSSLLSLFYALVLPRANDFLGKAVKRSLTDYVDNGDTSHTVAVWHPANDTDLLGSPDHVLVTGVVYEWDDLRRPSDPEKDRDRLGISWYAFSAVPGVIDAATLPILDEQGHALRKTAFLDALRQINIQHPHAVELQIPRSQREWTDVLKTRGLDPELFRTQKQMNHVEGGVEDLFRFASAREFINFLLDLTVKPEDTMNVAESLSAIATTIAAKPAKIVERDFCLQAATGLDLVAEAREYRAEAAKELAAATKIAADLSAAFAATINAAKVERSSLSVERETAQRAATKANSDRSAADALIYLYRARGASLHVEETTRVHAEAEGALAKAKQAVAGWRLTHALAEHEELTLQLASVRAAAARERSDTAPLRTEHDRHASRLVGRLNTLATNADGSSATAARRAESALRAAEAMEQAARQSQFSAVEASRAAASARTLLDGLKNDMNLAVQSGALPNEGSDPAAISLEVRGRYDKDVSDRGMVRDRRKKRPGERRDRTAKLRDITGEYHRLDHERGSVAAELDSLTQRANSLRVTTRLRNLAEATDDAPIDLWSEHVLVSRRLSDAVIACDEALTREAAARTDDERALDSQARTGLWPSSLDAARVCEALTSAGVPAQSGWEHLSMVLPKTALDTTLRDPVLNRIGCGLVVPSDRMEDAVRSLNELDTVTTALVGVYTAATVTHLVDNADLSTPSDDPAAWLGLHPGLVDAVAAESAALSLNAAKSDYDTRKTALVDQRETDRELLREFAAFIDDCPPGHLESLAARLDGMDHELASVGAAMTRIQVGLDKLAADDEEDANTERDLTDRIAALERALGTLTALAQKTEQSSKWGKDFKTAIEQENYQSQQSLERARDAAAARETASNLRHEAKTAADEASIHRRDAVNVIFLDERPGTCSDDSPLTLDALRVAVANAMRDYEVRTSSSVLGERDRNLSKRLSAVAVQIEAEPQNVQELGRSLLRSAGGQSEYTRRNAVAAAEALKSRAEGEVAVAVSSIGMAKEALQKVEAVRTAVPRRALPVEPATAKQAEVLHAEQERLAQEAQEARSAAERALASLDAEDRALESRIKTFALLRDNLPDNEAAFDPYAGDEDAAQRQKRDVISALNDALERNRQAEKDLTEAVGHLRRTGAQYPSVASPSRDRLLNDKDDALAQNAQNLSFNLSLRAKTIEGELEGIAKSQAIVTNLLAHLVSDNLELLKKAERYSKLPTTVGAWAGKHMLRIRFDAPNNDRDLCTYIDRVIERRIAEGIKAEGLPLLKEALHEVVGPRGFTVKVLKPTQEKDTTSEDITRLGKWSGGEKLTVCVALYCTIAALRAANSGRQGRSGGVLILDNPIGRASHGTLVRLQRDVARARDVQLIYTTGVKDPDAISRFPNVIRLDNRIGRTHNRRYIVEAPAEVSEARNGLVSGTRVAHLDRDDRSAEQP